MYEMSPEIEAYYADGCMRCPLGGTPECKVNTWREVMKPLRRIAIDCGLTEVRKWGVPCYTLNGSNVLIISAFKEYSSISFFKGSLLQDTDGILVSPGENSQAARLIKFTDIREVMELEPVIRAYIHEAIEVEKAGLKVDFKAKKDPELPEELQTILNEDPFLKEAFENLTPGRQRGYSLYFSAPKQSKTRISRIEKCIPMILKGKGLHDR